MQGKFRFFQCIRFHRSIEILSVILYLLCCAPPVNGQATPLSNAYGPQKEIPGYIGNEACAKCHAKMYESYKRTPMARSSGPAGENLITGEFTHKASGVHYSVYRDGDNVWLSFNRPGDPLIHDKRQFLYYIGEGRRGRTYLFSVDGFLFESPVNWYADSRMWDMAPAYGDAKEIPLNLPATTSCLHCHVSGLRPPHDGTENHYDSPPFLFSGITCERCHGPGAAHAKGAPAVNPAKLPAKLRDQVCMQCHLEGNAAIERAGKHIYDYRPGDDLSEYVRYFVLVGNVPLGLRATSQFEALAQSACKEKSGDAMSCTTCHNPHESVAPETRIAFYRGKCIACHGSAFAAKHHPKQEDCLECHMPRSSSTDVAHTQVTDHRIPRIVAKHLDEPSNTLPNLVAFPSSPQSATDIRELALAWQSMVTSGMTMAQSRAEQFLREAVKNSPGDPALLSALAYTAQRRGEFDQARALYEKALQQDPTSVDAATNLGVLEAQQGHLAQAMQLWQPAFERNPAKSEIGMNLARAYCDAGQLEAARNSALRVLRFNPDLGAAKKLFLGLNSSPPRCVF